ncbi:chromate transporter [Gottfriedia sp. NPDC056225]|uniref:chromate transporter n=1 Tax=Gottfriedia sp. NPDC056225 TaxID=3345751 RepID=UPI0035E23E40
MKKWWKLVLEIFWTFFKISPVTFGGGFAMIPVIEREVVIKRGWLKKQDVANVFAIAQSAPGAIAINSATFIGYRVAGLKGAITAMLGIMLPNFLIVISLCILFIHFQYNHTIEAAFKGIQASIVALITYAGYQIGCTAVFDKTTFFIVVVSILILLFSDINLIIIILSGGITGILSIKVKSWLGLMIKLEKVEIQEYKDSEYFMGDGI